MQNKNLEEELENKYKKIIALVEEENIKKRERYAIQEEIAKLTKGKDVFYCTKCGAIRRITKKTRSYGPPLAFDSAFSGYGGIEKNYYCEKCKTEIPFYVYQILY